jgi:hypothetical protein
MSYNLWSLIALHFCSLIAMNTRHGGEGRQLLSVDGEEEKTAVFALSNFKSRQTQLTLFCLPLCR